MTLIVICIVMSALGAVLGVRSYLRRLSAGSGSRAIGYVHGVVTTLSLVLLVIYAVLYSAAVPSWGFGFFAAAAIAGFILFGFDLAKRRLPRWLVFLHGALALVGLAFLVVFIFKGGA